ncbi:hypothetical protein [Kitasatospora sp. NPDC085464]|uniref:hypothetical protein n=1 Tax=Kitasatospora sp. NPDC085464 TaxID=3364063 RepID=UPI0037C5BBF7
MEPRPDAPANPVIGKVEATVFTDAERAAPEPAQQAARIAGAGGARGSFHPHG